MSRSLSFNWCGDRSFTPRNFIDTLDKDDREERKYSAEEKDVDEAEFKKSVSERKKEIERRISEEQDKKREPSGAVLRRSESRGRSVDRGDRDSKTEKEVFDEKSVSPEPADLTFDEKRLSFELGTLAKEKQAKVEATQRLVEAEKAVQQVEKTVQQVEPQLSFQEKRLSFEKGLVRSSEDRPELDPKALRKTKIETISTTETTTKPSIIEKVLIEATKETTLMEGVTRGLADFKQKEKLVTQPQEVISPKLSSTPPPSPAEALKSKAGEEWKSTPTSDTDGVQKTPKSQEPAELAFVSSPLRELPKQLLADLKFEQPKEPQLSSPPLNIFDEDKFIGNPFVSDSNSPSIFRRPHQAADYVIFDDEEWDTQNVVDFGDFSNQTVPDSDEYTPEKFLEDSTKSEPKLKTSTEMDKPFKESNADIKKDLPASSSETRVFQEPLIRTTTTVTEVVSTARPDGVTVTTVETEKLFRPFHQPFTFNDFSKVSDAGDGDSICDFQMNLKRPEENAQLDESLRVIVDLTESCKTSSEDLMQNADKSETENLVEIVDVTEELVISPQAQPPSQANVISDNTADLLRRLDECLTDDFPTKFAASKQTNDSSQKNEAILPPVSPFEQTPLPAQVGNAIKEMNVGPTPSHSNDPRNNRYLGSGGESISRLEDELILLEQLEDRIKILKDEEAKTELDIEESAVAKPDATITSLKSDFRSVEPTPTVVDIPSVGDVQDEVIAQVIEEAQIIVASGAVRDEPSGSKAETHEEKSRKKKNRKRRSKKQREGDVEADDTLYVSQSSEEHVKQNIGAKQIPDPQNSKQNSSKQSENEFQKIVSQLSVEEVDAALQIWNKDFSAPSPQSQSGTVGYLYTRGHNAVFK